LKRRKRGKNLKENVKHYFYIYDTKRVPVRLRSVISDVIGVIHEQSTRVALPCGVGSAGSAPRWRHSIQQRARVVTWLLGDQNIVVVGSLLYRSLVVRCRCVAALGWNCMSRRRLRHQVPAKTVTDAILLFTLCYT